MTREDQALELLDDLVRLARGSRATRIEVETDELSLAVSVEPAPPASGPPAGAGPAAQPLVSRAERVSATTVGIFGAARDWSTGDDVKRGVLLGSIQSLGHMAEITSPVDGEIAEILVAGGAPVEYGQALFAITPRRLEAPHGRQER